MGIDPREPAVYPDLAREVEFIDQLALRFTLRSGVRFHSDIDSNTEAITAETVQREFERQAAEGSYLFTEVIDAVETPSADTLVLRLRAPFALLFELLARPEASIRGASRYAGFNHQVGSGPFVPAQVGDTGRAYGRNPAWHGGTPALGGISVRFGVGDPELDAAFVRGELEVREHPNADSRNAVTGRDDAVRITRPSHRQRGLGLSLLGRKDGQTVRWVEAFQDDRVRRAVSLGLDRDALLELDGSQISGPVGPAHAGDALPAQELETHQLLQHDPSEARALLTAAGAEELSFRVQHLDTSGMLPVARLAVQQLREAGFAPRSMAMGQSEWESAFLRGDFEACVFELESLETPDLGLRLHTSEGLNGLFSLWGYSNPVYDSAVRDALSEIDPAMRAERSHAAQRLLLDGVSAMFPIASPREHATVAPGVRGYAFDAYGFNAGYLAAGWTLEESMSSGGMR